ncbi:MAG TPA: hypothetical protein VFD58_00740 [Blastocatellia bacterium]|nr:hypothetical protein [Blastocatellia bacterium]
MTESLTLNGKRQRPSPRRLALCLMSLALFMQVPLACTQSRTTATAAPQTAITIPPAPSTPAALDLPVKVTRRPATFGVPLKESANVRDATKVVLKDAAGKTVPAQFRVLSRWRGTALDAGRPVKWLLVDADAPAGDYRLTLGGENPKPAAGIATTDGEALQINAARIRMRVPKQGTTLLAGLELDGSERLKQPVTITMELPHATLLVEKVFAARRELHVSDSSALTAGMRVRFEHLSEFAFDIDKGNPYFAPRDELAVGRTYRLDEGTPRQEDVFVVKTDESWHLATRQPLRFPHPRGARIRDLAAEAETATVQSVNGQTVRLAAPLKDVHSAFERIVAADETSPLRLTACADETRVEESGPLRTVIRQDGHFQVEGSGRAAAVTLLRFTLRYHVYAGQPFVRVQFRMINTGPFGFGGERTKQPPYASHVMLSGLSVNLPFAVSPDSAARAQREEAATGPRGSAGKRPATVVVAGPANRNVEVTVPEFSENFPKLLVADTGGVRFDILPSAARPANQTAGSKANNSQSADLPPLPLSNDYYIFDGARAKSTEFYFGSDTRAAATLTNSFGASIDPAYVASSKAVRPVMVERRDWKKYFADDPQMRTSATRLERWLATAYAREANEDPEGKSIYEVRQEGRHYGWRNFGDLEWADGYNNLHYDLPYIMLREYLRTGDARAYQLGSEMARYRADWGQHQAEDYYDSYHTWNFRGMAFYEKGDHGTYKEPLPTHHWIEGLWLYWALTGDEAVHQSAIEGAEVLMRASFTYENSLSWGETRWVGWPVLALMAAWRYGGEIRYLEKARSSAYLLVKTEEDYGRKGYFIPQGGVGDSTKLFMWGGYAQLGIIEYWRETGDQRVADYLVRIADWVVGKEGRQRPVLTGGVTKPDGTYQPLGAPNVWYPDKENEPPVVALGMTAIPLLSVTAQISGRADLRAKAQQLFRDTTWFRDVWTDGVNPGEPSVITFRSRMYSGSYPKVYGQFSLFAPEYLAERMAGQGK